MKITITLTEAEHKALACIALDPKDWVENAAKARAALAMEEIYSRESAKAIADPLVKTFSADKEEVVLSSSVLTLAEIQANYEATVLVGE